MVPSRLARVLVPIGALAALLVAPVVALLAGIALALTLDNPWPRQTRALAQRTLAGSVIGLGAGMNLAVVGRVGLHGLGVTAVSIATALVLGALLGRGLRVSRDSSLLVTVGTAICGGSAIAAIAPAIRANEDDVSIALITVFVLNAVALVVFPVVGHRLHLGQDAFGMWCALAIHDTSSVVGAAAHYGHRALEVATAAKLARALWIVPVSFGVAFTRARTVARDAAHPAPRRPWFIAGFVGAAALVTCVPSLAPAGRGVALAAHRLLAATLFLVGLGLTRPALRRLGVRPLVHGIALWVTLATAMLAAIVAGIVGS